MQQSADRIAHEEYLELFYSDCDIDDFYTNLFYNVTFSILLSFQNIIDYAIARISL